MSWHLINNSVLEYLAPSLRELLAKYHEWDKIEELRLRIGQPLIIRSTTGQSGICRSGVCAIRDSHIVTEQELTRSLQFMTNNSWYALEDEVRSGYLTLGSGHRIGLSGKIVLDNGAIKTIKYVTGLNIRIARQVIGAADQVMPRLYRNHQLLSTLIVSPPGCGKTTLLRDIARQVSNLGLEVTIIDERSEIAACHQGVPQLDVGVRTDVLDGCPKAAGMLMALRGLAPHVIVTDEVGHPDDGLALADALRSGVKVISSCHGSSLPEVKKRAWVKTSQSVFEQVIILSRKNGPGTVEQVLKWD